MAAVGGMTEDEQPEFVASRMDSDLPFILSDAGVSRGSKVSIARRFGTLKKFNAIADTRAEVRTSCLNKNPKVGQEWEQSGNKAGTN